MTVAVKLHVSSHAGDSRVTFEAPDSILFLSHLVIDGVEYFTQGDVNIAFGGSEGFMLLELHKPRPEQHRDDNKWRREGYQNLRAAFADRLDDISDDTTDELLILMVRSLEIVEKPVYTWPLPTPPPALGVG